VIGIGMETITIRPTKQWNTR